MPPAYRRNPGAESAPLDSETIVFSPEANRFCLLNSTASVLWQALESPRTPDALAAELCQAFDGVTREVAERDVATALENFRALSLVAPVL